MNLEGNNQQTKIAVKKFSFFFKAELQCIKVGSKLSLLQVRSHDFEPTFIIFCLN